MKFTVLTLFPEIIEAYFKASIMGKAVERGIVDYSLVNIRDYALDKHHSCDDAPYGGGAGMLMLADPLGRALEAAGAGDAGKRVVYLSPSGRPFSQAAARSYAACDELVLVCGRYEGIDQRIIDLYVDDEVSVGDYVLSSGELASLVLIDAVYRLLEGVIAGESLEEESFSGAGEDRAGECLLEYPQYTRPELYQGLAVPPVLLSGHHANIRRWRRERQVEKTLAVRPDLIARGREEGLFDAETLRMIEELSDERN
jgi:tRNA (guanine37-N1)-methyltransferase